MAKEYLENPDKEEKEFILSGLLSQGQTLSDHTLPLMRPNYVEFYNKFFNLVRKQIHNFPNVKYPRKVSRFEDKLVRITSNEPMSVLIRLPYKTMVRIMSSFWSDYNAFAQFLYTYVPLLNNFTLK